MSGTRQAQALATARREEALARSVDKPVKPSRKASTKERGAAPDATAPAHIPVREVSVGGAASAPKLVRPKKPDAFVAKVPKAAQGTTKSSP